MPRYGGATAVPTRPARSRPFMVSVVPKFVIRYSYYAFIFSLPFEMAEVTIAGLPLARLLGLLFLAVTILQPRQLYKRPPKAFWYFAVYIAVTAASGINAIMDAPQSGMFVSPIITTLFTRIQLLVFFWLSFNLLASQEVMKGTALTLAFSCVILAVLQMFGLTASEVGQGRETAFDANPNTLSAVMSVGLLALVGLAYGRKDVDKKVRLLAWASSAILLLTIVRAGSRGTMIAVAVALVALTVKPHKIREKLKAGVVALLVIASLIWASFSIDTIRERWEKTYYEGDVAGRDVIYPMAWGMFLEKPLLGWGPIIHFHELGNRLGKEKRDPHNLYLWLLIETGIIGAIPFLAGVWLCFRSAWRARFISGTTLPLAWMIFFLIVATKGTWLVQKILWVILAYALTSGKQIMTHPVRKRFRALPGSMKMRSPHPRVPRMPAART